MTELKLKVRNEDEDKQLDGESVKFSPWQPWPCAHCTAQDLEGSALDYQS